MHHLTPDLVFVHQAMLRDEASAARLAASVRPPRPKRRVTSVLALVRRSQRRVPVTT
jgi:hypothetical protein